MSKQTTKPVKELEKQDESSSPVASGFGNQDTEQMQTFGQAPGSDVTVFDEEFRTIIRRRS